MAAMGPWILVATVLSAVNVVLLASLTVVWLRNYRTFGSAMTLGLATFAAAMLAENAVAIYFFFTTGMFYAGDVRVRQAVAVLRSLQTLALVFLSAVTLR